jgi:tetratricopeptide (TPR) repeat protein
LYGSSFDGIFDGIFDGELNRPLRAALQFVGGEAVRVAEGMLRAGDRRAAERALSTLDPVLASQVASAAGAPDLAVRILKRALREQPNDRYLPRRLAVAHARAGETTRAASQLERWIELLPPHHSRAHHAALMELGELYATTGSRSGLRDVGEALFTALGGSHALLALPQSSVTALRLHEERVAELLDFHVRHDLEREFVRGALAAPPEDLALTTALAGRELRSSEREALARRLARRPFGAWTDGEWRAAVAAIGERPAPPPASWGRLRSTNAAISDDR